MPYAVRWRIQRHWKFALPAFACLPLHTITSNTTIEQLNQTNQPVKIAMALGWSKEDMGRIIADSKRRQAEKEREAQRARENAEALRKKRLVLEQEVANKKTRL